MAKFFVLILTLGLMISSCGRDESTLAPVNENNPFEDGKPDQNSKDFIDVVLGQWYSGDCETLSQTSSTLSQMKFTFNRPFAWKDDFFAKDSLEFSGDLVVEQIRYENPYCLGLGDKKQLWPQKNTVFQNISVIKETIRQNEFFALYLETSTTQIGQLDQGSGLYLKFSKKSLGVEIDVVSRFSYIGKVYTLNPIQENNFIKNLNFTTKINPVKSQNLSQLQSPLLKSLITQNQCGFYSLYQQIYSNPAGQIAYGVLNAQDGLINIATGIVYNFGGTSQFQANNLDWLVVDQKIYTDKNFILSETQGQILIQNPTIHLETFLTPPEKLSFQEISEFLKDYGTSPYAIFTECPSY